MTIDRKTLRARAEAAVNAVVPWNVTNQPGYDRRWVAFAEVANPAAVLALLDRLDEVEALLARCEGHVELSDGQAQDDLNNEIRAALSAGHQSEEGRDGVPA